MTVFALGVQRNPEIAQAVMQNDIELFQRLLQQQHQRRLDLKHQSQQPSVSGILCVMHQHSLICYSPKMWSNLYWRGFIRHPPKDSETWITPESHKLLDMYKSCWFLLASFLLQSISMHWFSPLFIAHFSFVSVIIQGEWETF